MSALSEDNSRLKSFHSLKSFGVSDIEAEEEQKTIAEND